MAFYRDSDGAIWQTGVDKHILYCISDPDDGLPGYSVGLAVSYAQVEESYGPMTEVEPTGWKEV